MPIWGAKLAKDERGTARNPFIYRGTTLFESGTTMVQQALSVFLRLKFCLTIGKTESKNEL